MERKLNRIWTTRIVTPMEMVMKSPRHPTCLANKSIKVEMMDVGRSYGSEEDNKVGGKIKVKQEIRGIRNLLL